MARAATATQTDGLALRSGRPGRVWSPIVGRGAGLLLMMPLLLLFLGLVLLPLGSLGYDSLTTGDGPRNYVNVITDPTFRSVLTTTVVSSLLVTAICLCSGGLLAWYLSSTPRRVVRVMLWLAILLPMLMGTVMRNYALLLIFARDGLFNSALGGFGMPPVDLLYTTPAVVVGIAYTMLPYAALSLYSVFLTVDRNLLLAAQSLGVTRLRALAGIALPIAMPGIVATAAIVFAISLGFYVTPVLLGGASAPFMASYVQENLLSFYNLPLASTASVIVLAVAVLVLAVTVRAVGGRRLMRSMT